MVLYHGFDDRPDGCLIAGCWPANSAILLSSPHSGISYPSSFDQFSVLPRSDLISLSDGPVHEMLGFAEHSGISLIHAEYARAVVDLNRSPDECLPFLIEKPGSRPVHLTDRSRAGLGVVPTRIGSRPIYTKALPASELNWRIDHVHTSYHQRLALTHRQLASRFGVGLLLDIHSMPDTVARYRGRRVDISLGNGHGRTCSNDWLKDAAAHFEACGLRTSINDPYAGGYVTRHHGRPERGRPALQIELRRGLFMDENHRLKSQAEELSGHLATFCDFANSTIGRWHRSPRVNAA